MKFARLVLVLLVTASLACQQPASDIRSELAAIDLRHPRDLNDYLARCSLVRTYIPRLEEFYKQGNVTIARLKQQHSTDASFVRMAEFFEQWNAQDRVGIEVLKEELRAASDMALLPAAKRQAFFDSTIKPIQKREDNNVLVEVDMARKAQKNGIPLPDDIIKWLQVH